MYIEHNINSPSYSVDLGIQSQIFHLLRKNTRYAFEFIYWFIYFILFFYIFLFYFIHLFIFFFFFFLGGGHVPRCLQTYFYELHKVLVRYPTRHFCNRHVHMLQNGASWDNCLGNKCWDFWDWALAHSLTTPVCCMACILQNKTRCPWTRYVTWPSKYSTWI